MNKNGNAFFGILTMTDDSRYDALVFHITQNARHGRGRYRVSANGLSLYCDELDQTCDIRDLSSSGCSLRVQAERLIVGRIFNGDLHIGNSCYLADLKLKVVRQLDHNTIACAFQVLSRQQEIMLDKLLLEIQKRSLAARAALRKRKKH
jgi:hypothetical protein